MTMEFKLAETLYRFCRNTNCMYAISAIPSPYYRGSVNGFRKNPRIQTKYWTDFEL